MQYDLLIQGGTLVLPGEGLAAGDIAIADGRIAAILAPGSRVSAERTLDARGLHIFPGIVDPHTHIGLGNGLADWGSETRSAALGGVTTLFTYLMSGESYFPVIAENLAAAQREAVIDYGFHLVPCSEVHLAELERYASEFGVTSFKFFTSFRGDEGAYLGITGADDGYLFRYLRAVARLPGGLACVHPENIEVVWQLRRELQEAGRDDLPAWNESRPDFVEAECVSRTMIYAAQVGCPLYLVHFSSAAALREYRAGKERFPGVPFWGETCPHYLTHTSDPALGPLGKVNPPLRSPADTEALWQAIFSGLIDTIGSDHVPRPRARKTGSIWKASAGFPGLATLLPVMLSEGYHQRGLPLDRIAELCATNPARALGVGRRKGCLHVGWDGDLTLVDLAAERTVDSAQLGSFSDYSLYEGWRLRGWPVATIVRGKVVMEEGAVVAEGGWGTYLPRRGE
ncbi:MAG: dihydroorotase-like protein [Dehalococcoidia bacterium]|nr:MAG: dihydroorotase-like protein [Dehalococcoidia bacterium]